MVFNIILSEETLSTFLENNLQLVSKLNFKYLIKECGPNENILCLQIFSEQENYSMEYVMVKMVNNEDFHKKKKKYSKVLQNVFTIQDDKEEVYLVFLKKSILFPSENNLDHLTAILRNLAQLQATDLVTTKGNTIRPSVENVANVVTALERFYNKDDISDQIPIIEESVNELFKYGLSVKSVRNISVSNVLLTAKEDKCVFLDSQDDKVLRSPLYDALIYIFGLSNDDFRQRHLKTLLSSYQQAFIYFVQKFDDSIKTKFNQTVLENHVKILLPLIKFKTAKHLIEQEKSINNQNLKELLQNITNSLKCRQISYEDCLETVSNKLGTTDYELENYELIPLDEKNGHLGEYFNIKFKVNCSGKTEELSMFAKILNASNEVLNGIIDVASKKEQFFFRTLIPLFKQYGLESLVDFAPNCYFDRLSDVIIQDNLAELSYKPLRPDAKVGYDVLKTVFLKVARLHACSLLLEDRMSQSQDKTVRMGDMYGDFFEDWLFEAKGDAPKSPVHPIYCKRGIDKLIDSFVCAPRAISKEEFHKIVDAIYNVFTERLNYPAKQFRNVICHGDLYSSNMLIKYDENDRAENCFLIDYQGLRYAPITSDLLMIAYCNTYKDVRDKYLDQLLKEYYNELQEIMSEFGKDVNTFYTYEEFTNSIKYMKPIVMFAAISYAQIIGLPHKKREEIFFDKKLFDYYLLENREEYIKLILTFGDDFELYMKGLIDDLYEICLDQ